MQSVSSIVIVAGAMLDSLLSFFEAYPWGIYACFLILPFIQEDAAVIGSAAAAVTGLGEPWFLGAAIITGLTFSDLWKYWAGRAAVSHKWAKKYADKPTVKKARDGVVNHLASSLMIVRFIPGTRIPFYVASGFFHAPFPKFAFFIIFSGAMYISITFVFFYIFGELAGEDQAHKWLPVIAIALVSVLVIIQVVRRKLAREKAMDAQPFNKGEGDEPAK